MKKNPATPIVKRSISLKYFFFITIVLCSALVPLVFDFSLYQIFAMSKAAFLKISFGIIILLWCLSRFFTKENNEIINQSKTFALPLLLMVLFSILSTIFSIDPWISLVGVYTRQSGLQEIITMVIIYFILTSSLRKVTHLHTLLLIITISATIIGAYAIIQFIGLDFLRLVTKSFDKALSTTGNSNLCGNFLALALPIPFFLIMKSNNYWSKIFLTISTLIILLGVAFAQSRSAWIAVFGLAIISPTLFVWSFKESKGREKIFKVFIAFACFNVLFILNSFIIERSSNYIIVAILIIILITILLLWLIQPRITGISFKHPVLLFTSILFLTYLIIVPSKIWGTPHSESLRRYFLIFHFERNPRYFLIRDSFKIIRDNFFFGAGPGTYRIAFMPYKTLKHEIREPRANYDSPHNAYLNMWGTRGTLAFLVYLWILLRFIKKSLIILGNKSTKKEDKLLIFVLLSALFSYMIWAFGSFDSNVTTPILFMLLASLSFWEYQSKPENNENKTSFKHANLIIRSIALIIAPLSIASIYNAHGFYRADQYFAKGFQQKKVARGLQRSGKQKKAKLLFFKATQNMKKAVSLNPNESSYSLRLTHVYFDLFNITNDKNYFYLIEKSLHQSFKHPWAHGDIYVAWLRLKLLQNQIDEAIEYGNKALKFIPYNSIVRSQLGFLYIKKQDPSLYKIAKEHFEYALLVDSKNLIAHTYLSEIFLKFKQYESAKKHALLALQHHPSKKMQLSNLLTRINNSMKAAK